jgi:intein-encoded DNA endonuclease-like protein
MVRDPRGGHNRKRVNEHFFKTWSPQMAYVLGFMFADGSLLDTNTSSRTYYLQFSNNDLDLLKKIRLVIKSEHDIYIRPSHVMKHKKKKYLAQTGYVFKFGNKVMYQDLLYLGMVHRKSKSMHLPKIPLEYFSHFLRGYFDGDGCIYTSVPKGRKSTRLRVIFSSGSKAFLSELSSLLAYILPIKPLHFYRTTGAYNLMANGGDSLKILDYMYADLGSSPYLTRKYSKYLIYRTLLIGPRMSKLV